MQYEITEAMLGNVMADATAFNNNIGRAGMVDSGSSVANRNINDVIKLLDKNVKQFDQLINRFATSNPGFAAGYHINAALENTGIHYSGIEGI